MLKYTFLVIVLISSSREGWGREKFTINVNYRNRTGAVLKSDPFTNINDGYYFFGREKVNWYVAYESRELNAELATFETDQKFDDIARYLNLLELRK